MKTPGTSKLFTKRTDAKSGATYYVLTEKVATYQQGFYFVNNSMTNDGRYLWFYASFPPVFDGALRQLGVIDFETDEIYLCNDTLFEHAAPYVDPETGVIYFTWRDRVFRRAPQKDAHTEVLAVIPTEGRPIHLSTHITFTPDKKEILLDVREGNTNFYVGTLNVETGVFTKWADAPFLLNHGQLNPKNPDLTLNAYDHYMDYVTGELCSIPCDENGVYQRLWTVTRDGVKTNYPPDHNYATHEWWSADGEKIYYVNEYGIHRIHLTTGEHINIHPSHPWHAYSSRDESFYVYDEVVYDKYDKWYRGCPAKVTFYDAKTDKEIDIVSYMPANDFTPDNPCDYHIDPHPRITDNEKYIVFTTTELGGVDLAVVSVKSLLEKTR